MSDLPHVFPRLQASWLLSRSCLLDDSALELVHDFEDIAQYRIRQLVGRTCLRFFGNGLRGMGICLSASLLRPMSLCNLLHAMPYPSVLATTRRSTSLEQIHFTMSMFGVTDGARMEQRQRSMYAVSNDWSKERATHACSR